MDANIGVTQLTAAGIAVWAIQQLKQSKYFPWLTQESHRWVKRIASVATAIGVHTGIAAVWNSGAPPTGYAYQLIINIPPLTVVLVTMWHWLGQYVMQEGWYQVVWNRPTLTTTPHGPVEPVKITS